MELKFIMPDWDDYLDPNFNFEKDEFSADKRQRNDIYLHELLGNDVPYDGILVSLAQILKKKGALKGFKEGNNTVGIRELMNIPEKLQIIGDCGAFSYKDEDEPVFTPEQAASLYHILGFDVGVSVDHMAISEVIKVVEKGNTQKIALSEEQKRARVQLTVNNARDFINEVKVKNYSFIPMGSIQGVTVEDYVDSFKKYIAFGYEQIAVGSLIPKTDDDIKIIIEAIGLEYRKLPLEKREKIKIHLLGILRPKLLRYYKENGITSFDSASYFRKAWLRSDKNYLGVNNEWYAALRVPQSTLPRNKKMLLEQGHSLESVRLLELKVLGLLSDYDKGHANLDEVLKYLMEYDNLFERLFENGDKIREAYKRTLKDRPWKLCNCKICSEIGIHVAIFRGFNRNKRRGFHNTYVFYCGLKKGILTRHNYE